MRLCFRGLFPPMVGFVVISWDVLSWLFLADWAYASSVADSRKASLSIAVCRLISLVKIHIKKRERMNYDDQERMKP
jgi:hypothetical protein